MAEALERRSTLAIKSELTNLTGTCASSGTTVTGTGTAFTTELKVGDVIGVFNKGFRWVTNIASATSLTVNSAFDVALSGDTVKKQNYGADPTVAAADCIEFVDFTFEPSRDEITRNVVRDTFDELEPMMGIETVGGDITVELHGNGTAGSIPDADPLWLAAIGERNTSTAGTTTTGCTTTSIVLTTGGGANFKVGDAILIDPAGGSAYEVAWITAISTDTLTITPALSAAPGSGRAVGAGVHYKLSKNQLKSFWAQYWRGDIVLEKYKGNMVNSLAMDFAIGAVINPKFSCKGKETAAPTSASYGLGAGTYDSGNVHVGRYMVIKIGNTLIALKSCAFTIANELAEIQDLTSSGILKQLFTKRTISGSFSLLYENADIEIAFRNGTTAELIILSSTGGVNLIAGNTFAIRFPKIKYTKAGKTKDAGVYNYDVTWKAVMTYGEDSLTSLSLL